MDHQHRTMRVTLNEQSQSLWQSQNLEHLRYEYDLSPDDVVIDVGAYRGEWASKIYRRYQCQLILVEPGPWSNSFEHGEVINKAAATYDGMMNFGGGYYYTSAYETPAYRYECFDINSLLSKYNEIALIKINIEGGEYPLLNHIIDHGYHQRVRDFQVQFHQIEGEDYERWYAEIEAKLMKTHHPLWRYRMCWESWRRM